MKTLYLLSCCLITLLSSDIQKKSSNLDVNVLVGKWKLDMSPQDKTDDNFAFMEITKATDNSFEGYFYREGVNIKNANINTQLGIIYGALISGDGTGTYNTTFYYDDGIIHGTTHALNRNFLSVWTATKSN
ncbi:hypothetical protein ACWGOQ_0011455 [Aquimarina sp. M1]